MNVVVEVYDTERPLTADVKKDGIHIPIPRPGILNVTPYVAGDSSIPGVRRIVKLASNEGALGPSPKAVAASRGNADSLCRYPDGGCSQLRAALGMRYGLDPARIVCGAGSDELIGILTRAYAGPGDEVLYSRYAFLMFPIIATANGATPVPAAERNLTADVDALLSKQTQKTRIVYLANPNNPTGTYLPYSEIKRLHAGLPGNVLLVLDAAYAEYMVAADYHDGLELAREAENVVVLHTFSKIYALAGLRLGWGFGSSRIIDVVNRVRGTFNVTATAQLAGLAALEDRAWTEKVRAHTITWRRWTVDALRRLGFDVPDGVGNFILCHFADVADADAADAFLRRRGLIVRKLGPYSLAGSLRITVGTEEEMRLLVDGLAAYRSGQPRPRAQ